MSVTIITFLLFGLLPRQAKAQTAQTQVKGQNVTKVTVGNNNTAEAVFVQVGPKRWNHYYPDGKRLFTTHTETGRDEWSVYLTNGNLNMNVVINLFKKTVTYFNSRSKQQTYSGKIMNAIGNKSTPSTNSNTPSNSNLSLEQQCYNAVQGKVAWSKGGSKTWGAANVQKLCKGTTNPDATIACFKREIEIHNSWSKGVDACKANTTVAKTKGPVTTSNVAEVKFFSINNLTLAEARSLAARNGWELATPEQVTAAWKNKGLNAFAYGRTSDGKFCVPIQQNNGSFKRGANCGITGGNQGFLYVKKALSTNKRFGANITGPPRTIGTKYAFRYLHLVWNPSVQHPSQNAFGLGDAVMMRRAAALQLRTQRRSASNTNINSLLGSISRDATARFQFAPCLLKVTFEALATPRPDSAQLAFRKNFAAYMGLMRFEHSLATRELWNSFKRENERSQIRPNNIGPTTANLLPMRPADVNKFLASHTNPMYLGNKGQSAIRILLEPAAAASLPQYRNSGLGRLGADMDAVAAGLGVGTTITGSAATLGLVSVAVFTSAGVVKAVTPGVTIPLTTAILKAGTLSGKASGLALSSAGGIGVAIAIAVAVLIGIAIANQARSDAMDRRLKREFDLGFDPVNVYSLINDRNISKRGLNRAAVFSYLLKMLIADPADRGQLTLKQPNPRTVKPGLKKPGVVTVRHKGAYVSNVVLTYLDENRRTVRVVRNRRPVGTVDRFDIPGEATNVRLFIEMYTGLLGKQSKVTLINRVLRRNELNNKCFTTVGTTIIGRGLKESVCK